MRYEGKIYGKINGRYIELTESVMDLEKQRDELQSRLTEIAKGNPTNKRNPDTAYLEGKLVSEKNTYKLERDEAVRLLKWCYGFAPNIIKKDIGKLFDQLD